MNQNDSIVYKGLCRLFLMFVQAGGYRNILKLSCGPLAFASYGVFWGAEGCLGLRSWAGGLGWGGDIGRGG